MKPPAYVVCMYVTISWFTRSLGLRASSARTAKSTVLSSPKMTHPMRKTLRDLGEAARYMMSGARVPYKTASTTDGAKSKLNGAPPTGEGKKWPAGADMGVS